MTTLVSTSDGSEPTTTIRHNWRMEIFSEFGAIPTVRAHREQVVYESDTGTVLSVTKDRMVDRSFADLPPGPQATIIALATLADTWELEDLQNAATPS